MSYGQGQYGGPPPQQGYGYAPPQNFGPQGGPPPQQWQQPSPQGYHQGPPQNYGQQQFQQAPSHQQWGSPGQFQQQQQYGGGPPALPSPGYDPNMFAQGDASRDANALRAAMKVLISILSKPDPLQMALLRNTFNSIHRRSLESDTSSETSGHFRDGLVALVKGPLMSDAHNVNKAIKGIGTRESLLNDVLIGRSNADMRAIKQAYQREFHKSMESDVRGDLSMKTEKLFDLIMAANRAEESSPIIPQAVEKDVADLYAATIGRVHGADQITVCAILTARSDAQIRTIAQQFEQRYHQPLSKAMEKRFDGHMEDALVLLVNRATDPAMTDAQTLEDCMKGVGTADYRLVQAVVRIHWNRQHMDQVKRAYQHRFKRDLIGRIKGEISNKHYEALMVACLT